ncbi:hypothetical protein CsSME_00013779 [Camellia sinensis var. sinensis]
MGICRDVKAQPKQQPKLGGNRAALFVYATVGLENMAFIANAVSLVTYFYGYMNFSLTKSATTLTNLMGTTFLLSLFGGFISDTYLSRFKTCILFGSIEVVVFVAAIRNRKLPIPETTKELHEIHDKEPRTGSEILERTDQFKFLDQAAIISTTQDASTSSINPGPWNMCTVTQVEETKIVVRMLPIILSTVFMNTCLAQLQTFTIQQSTTMDRSLLGFQVPGPSIPVIPLVFMFLLIPVYDRIFVPIVRKFTGIPTGITYLQRIGVGLVLSAISMAVAGFVETHRKSVAVKHNMVDSAGPLPVTVFLLGFQFAIFGLADMFTLVGLLEFFYAESSSGMKSLGTAISWCSLAFGYFLSSVMVEVVNRVSGGWLASNNLNRDKLNYFYWLLAGLSVVNFGAYLVCSSWYRYKKVEVKEVGTSDLEGKIEMGRV